MKIFIINVVFLMILQTSVASERFDSFDDRTQRYIISSLSRAIHVSSILIVHSRSDEWLRTDGDMDGGVQIVLGLRRFRRVMSLKDAPWADYDIIYCYVPPPLHMPRVRIGRPTREEDFPAPYQPSMSQMDELMRLVLLKPQGTLLKEYVSPGYQQRRGLENITRDALELSESDFIEKYGLAEVFSNQVYRLVEGCVFRVDPLLIPELPETESMRMNRSNQELKEARVPELQRISNLIHLTNREVSEIVFIAYLNEEDGIQKYAEACRMHDSLLVPMSEPVFETNLGRRLFEAVAESEGWSRSGGPGKRSQ